MTDPAPADSTAASPAARPVQVIMNPAARSGAAAAVRAELDTELGRRGVAYERIDTARPGHASGLAHEAARAGVPIVVATGGDGTVHEVANGLLRARAEMGSLATALAVIPCGTGNDFARIIARIRSRTAAYDALRRSAVRVVDAGLVRWSGGEEYFVNGMGTGIDVEVVRQLRKRSRLPGGVIYLRALLRALARYRPIPLRVTAGHEVVDSRAMMVAVCHGRRIGGAFRICPDSLPDDGLLDACFVEALAWHEIPATLFAVLRGTHAGRSRVRMLRAPAFALEVPPGTPLYVQLDGELRHTGDARTLHVSTLPGALRVIVGLETEG